MIQLRQYQTDLMQAIRRRFSLKDRSVLAVMPTGAGKTFTFCAITALSLKKGSKVLILVHRDSLLQQASNSLKSLGIPHARLSPNYPTDMTKAVQVASVQTLSRRIKRLKYQPDLIIIDEAHHATAGTWRKVIDFYSSAKVLGVTATPIRTDGRGLSEVFDSMVEGPTMAELVDWKFLVPPRIFAPPIDLDLKGVRKTAGDYNRKQLGERTDRTTITGDVVDHYTKLARNKRAVVFCVTVRHAQNVAAEFQAAGYPAKSISGGMSQAEIDQALADLGAGRIKVLTSCDLISEGTDIPAVEVAILLRKTASTALYIQQVGRVLRTAKGKTEAIILDHVGNCQEHGHPLDDQDWVEAFGAVKKKKKKKNDPTLSVRQCLNCYAVYRPAPTCPECGAAPEVKARKPPKVTKGELEEIKRQERRRKYIEQAQAKTLEDLIEVGKKRGYKSGWAHRIWAIRQAKRNGQTPPNRSGQGRFF